MPSIKPLPSIFTNQNVTIRATFFLNIAIPVTQERYFIRQLSLVTSRQFRNLTKHRPPTDNVRRLPSLNTVSENLILTWIRQTRTSHSTVSKYTVKCSTLNPHSRQTGMAGIAEGKESRVKHDATWWQEDPLTLYLLAAASCKQHSVLNFKPLVLN